MKAGRPLRPDPASHDRLWRHIIAASGEPVVRKSPPRQAYHCLIAVIEMDFRRSCLDFDFLKAGRIGRQVTGIRISIGEMANRSGQIGYQIKANGSHGGRIRTSYLAPRIRHVFLSFLLLINGQCGFSYSFSHQRCGCFIFRFFQWR